MRLIDADAFKEELKENYTFYGFSCLLNDFYVAIDEAPTIEPKRGAWKIEETESVWGKGYMLTCSECGNTFRVTENALPYEKYCRNCGASMREREDE